MHYYRGGADRGIGLLFGAPLVGGFLGGLFGAGIGGAFSRPPVVYGGVRPPYGYGPVPYGPVPYGPVPYGAPYGGAYPYY